MYFEQIKVTGLGCFSYVIGCPAVGACAVVDPKRDIQDYLDISRREGMRITHIIDTHVHADHISGNQELRAQTGAEILMYGTSPVAFPFEKVTEGQVLQIGAAKMHFLHTPGHTPDALSMLLTDTMRSDDPWMILTGDLLFVGDIGRPDLIGEAELDAQIRNLYDSLYEKLARYPDHLEVFPAHGMGSLCGRGMSSKASSTLGFERANNPMLGFDTFEDFHAAMSQSFPIRPKSFTHIIAINLDGAPLLAACPMDQAMSPDAFAERMAEPDTVVIDVRDTAAFSGMHIPESLNIGFEKQLANWVGMVVEPDRDILLVVNSHEEYERMVTELHRIGYDRILGWLHGGMTGWAFSGREVETLTQISVHNVRKKIENRSLPVLVDVRTPDEFNAGHLPDAKHVPLAQILTGEHDLSTGSDVVVYCGTGYRSNIAASELQKNGFGNIQGMAGGTIAWNQAGYDMG